MLLCLTLSISFTHTLSLSLLLSLRRSVCPSVILFWLSVRLCVFLSVYLSICLSVFGSELQFVICVFVCLFVHLSIYIFVCLFEIRVFLFWFNGYFLLFINMFYLFFCWPDCLYIYLSVFYKGVGQRAFWLFIGYCSHFWIGRPLQRVLISSSFLTLKFQS